MDKYNKMETKEREKNPILYQDVLFYPKIKK